MTPVQVRMARAALDLTTDELSRAAGLTLQDLEQLEKGGQDGAASAKLRTTFEGAGVTFLDPDGVRFDERQPGVRTVPLEEMNSYNDE
jgi:DNA-binding XRE family transcriptional regulator